MRSEIPADFEPIYQQTLDYIKSMAASYVARKNTSQVVDSASITALLQSVGNQTVSSGITEHFMVPVSKLAAVVGPLGETLKKIERQSHCQLTMDTAWSQHPSERRIILFGAKEDVSLAKRLLAERLEDSGGKSGGGGSSTLVQQVLVPVHRVGLVIGRGGETIRELQERTGARVTVAPEGAGGNPDERAITIVGDSLCVERAKQLIMEIVSGTGLGLAGLGSASKSAANSKQSFLQQAQIANLATATLFIPESFVGAFLGRRAEHLKQLQTLCSVKILLDQLAINAPPGRRAVYIAGQPASVVWCQQVVHQRLLDEMGPEAIDGLYEDGAIPANVTTSANTAESFDYAAYAAQYPEQYAAYYAYYQQQGYQ